MNARKLLKNGSYPSEIWSLWVSNTEPYRYQHHALPTKLTGHLIQM